jgi:cardiolipin synthase
MTSTQTLASVFGWAFAIWGSALYWWAGVLYVIQVRSLTPIEVAEPGDPIGSSPQGR